MESGGRGLIPSVVAQQVRETVLDYLRTTFALGDPEFERAVFDFLGSEASSPSPANPSSPRARGPRT